MKPSPPFVFKQFSVRQLHAAFKVGTDAVLLGSWVNIPLNTTCIVDVGTGTGILALMMAQRSSAVIHAIEIDPLSAIDADFNFKSSPWKERINLYIEDIATFASHTSVRADLLITNPPFFNHSLKNNDKRSSRARHTSELSFNKLWQAALLIMHPHASLAIVLPVNEMDIFAAQGQKHGWFIHRSCSVSSFEHSHPIRILAEFKQGKASQPEQTQLYLYQSHGQRSINYQWLTADFYL